MGAGFFCEEVKKMNCSLEKNTTKYLEETGLIDYLAELQELVKEVMISLNRGEYLDCAGVVETNFKLIAKQLYEAKVKKQISVEEAIDFVRGGFI